MTLETNQDVQPIPTIEQLLASPCVSYWLKSAVRALLARDVVDATNDAELLAAIMQRECDRALGKVSR